MDIVYILGEGSRWDNNELRYSLRSIEQNVKFDNVFIIGYLPSFVQNVIHIPYEDKHKNKQRNIHEKILAASNCKLISSKFILFNDDYFVLKPTEISEQVIFYTSETLYASRKKFSNNYREHIQATIQFFNGNDNHNFDTHYPTIIEKYYYKLINDSNKVNWEVNFGYLTKTIYGYNLGEYLLFNIINIIDPIVHKLADIKDNNIISTTSKITETMKKYLASKFPNKSKFEI